MKHKRHLDFELNLIPFIDLLSVCICFLLITAVWIQIGSMSAKQAVGGQPASETKKSPTMWMYLENNGDIGLDVKDAHVPAKMARLKVQNKAGKPDYEKITSIVTDLRNLEPQLLTALVQPKAGSVYEDIITAMESVKKAGILNLGVSPL